MHCLPPFLLLSVSCRPRKSRAVGMVAAGVMTAGLLVGGHAHAQELMCPAGRSDTSDFSTSTSTAAKATRLAEDTARRARDAQSPIELQADSWDAVVNGDINLQGNVVARQGSRTVQADALRMNPVTHELTAAGVVKFDDPQLSVQGSDASMDRTGGAQLLDTQFWLKDAAGHGSAARLAITPQGNLSLDNVSYTSCPPNSVGWELKLSDLDINQATQTGTGRNVRLKFAGLTLFYSPWLSFPVGDQRKSGFLFPAIGGSSRGGNSVAVPWYWNIATNMDDTITPHIDTARGFRLDNEFRYLGDNNKGTLVTGYLPHDNVTREWRGQAALKYQHDLHTALRLKIDAQAVQDDAWFEDFGQGRDQTSLVHLPRQAKLSLYGDYWHSSLQVQNWQTLDPVIRNSTSRPYTQLPSISVSGNQPLWRGLTLDMDAEVAHFTRGDITTTTNNITTTAVSMTGSRAWAAPTLRWPWRRNGMYVIPSVGWRYTGYQLQHLDASSSNDRSPSISAPAYSLDAGLTLERFGGKQQQRLYLLEPRLLYNYVPYRDQTALADVLFDTTLPLFDAAQVFETNRFNGPDRLGDANQISAGFTTRMLDARDGTQHLSATLGQLYYITRPCISSLTQLTCDNSVGSKASDVYGQLSLTRYRHVSISFGAQWSPTTQRSDQRNMTLQYRLDGNRVANLVYRYGRGTPDSTGALQNQVSQWEASTAWPIGRTLSGYARVVYSQLDGKFLDHFAGLEYRSCCWNIRTVVGRAVTTRTGQYDTQFKIQLELKGLSSVGTADSFLRSNITGYGTAD